MIQEIAIFAGALMLILKMAGTVAHRAEKLAIRFGEPYGTMLLTITAVLIEVILIGIMMTNSNNPGLARDTVYSALMIDIAGILGLAAFIGGWKHHEQKHNADGTGAYLATIFVMVGIVMVLPDFLPADSLVAHGVFASVTCVIMYAVFLYAQTKRHISYFQYTLAASGHHDEEVGNGKDAMVMLGSLVVIGVASEFMAHSLDPIAEHFGWPVAIAGVIVAAVSASSEIMTAIRAAVRNNMQAAINIGLGASVATLLLTIPAIEFIGYVSGKNIDLGLEPMQGAMLGMTLGAAYMTLNDGETNILEGAALLMLFAGFVMISCFG